MPFRLRGPAPIAFLTLLSCSAAFAAPPAPYQRVLVLSVDGLHDADLSDPLTAQFLPDVLDLAQHGVRYTNAHAVTPSDNFPNAVAQFTGATAKTSGIYYDDTYRRDYYPPNTVPGGASPGTGARWTADIDFDNTLLSGGGNADASSLNPYLLPTRLVNGQFLPVYPHDDLKVNTAFEVAKAAGLRTAYIDKHPSYEILNGPSGQGIDDFYGPESNARAAIVNGVLVDVTTAPPKTKLKSISNSIPLSEAYDDLRVDALLNQINGKTARGAAAPGVPNLFGLSFISVNTAQKDALNGGIDDFGGGNVVINTGYADALQHTNDNVRRVVDALKQNNLYDSTLIVLTAKHGQNPRVGAAQVINAETVTGTLFGANIPIRQATQDDLSMIWLDDQSQVADAKAALLASGISDSIDTILTGAQMLTVGVGDPATDDRSPDLIVKYKPGVLVSDSIKRAEHGGFTDDDTHIALILAGGVPSGLQDITIDQSVLDTQLAPTMLAALGLDPSLLQGVQIDGTQILPGAAVPEPATLALLAACGLAAFARRRRRMP